MIAIAAGPTSTVKRAGKMQRMSGNKSLTGVLAARSSASWLRFWRSCPAWMRRT
jgi:hypothetical protein